jgi:hypothetical protein
VRAFESECERTAVHCAAIVKKKKKKERVFSFGSRHRKRDKLEVFLGEILGSTTTEN